MMKYTHCALAGVILTASATQAFSADIIDPVVIDPAPAAVAVGGWYLRGYLGMTNQDFDGITSDLYLQPAIEAYGWHDSGSFASSPLAGVGVGYQFNDFLRGDVTVEYRGKADFYALDWKTVGGVTTTNDFTAKKSEWLVLANAYADLGDFGGIKPYLGAGIGASRNTISNLRDVNVLSSGAARAASDPSWEFAWALHAGLGFQVTDNVTFDLGYSYVNLGDGRTGPMLNDDPAWDIPNDGFVFNDLTSHDVKFGVRYLFN